MDISILTLILLVPLAGAILVALLPDRGKLPAWLALITTLVSFGLTLHLPYNSICLKAHYICPFQHAPHSMSAGRHCS